MSSPTIGHSSTPALGTRTQASRPAGTRLTRCNNQLPHIDPEHQHDASSDHHREQYGREWLAEQVNQKCGEPVTNQSCRSAENLLARQERDREHAKTGQSPPWNRDV